MSVSPGSSASGLEPTLPGPVHQLLTVEAAAARLGLTPAALRARCRRKARRERGEVVARLGAQVVAFKFGANWRLKFGD